MAKQMKKALCILLSVLLALSCFAVSAFAYTGYDRNGPNNALRVQSTVSVSGNTFAVGDTVTATINLNHPNDSVIGYQGFIVFDSSVLDFKSVTLQNGYEYYSSQLEPTSATQIDPTTLTMGIGGDPFTASSFDDIIGYCNLTTPAVINLAVLNLNGLEAGSEAVATVSFEAKASVESSKISLVPSIVFSPALGYLNCTASASTEGVYETAFSATAPSSSFKITGGPGPVVKHQVTFIWNTSPTTTDSTTIEVDEGSTPTAPTIPSHYEDGNYDYDFSGTWSPALGPVYAATTYIAQFTETFVSADYTAYDAARTAAINKRDNGTNWTADSVAALNTELNKDVQGKGRTEQAVVDAQKDAIIAAAEALQVQAAEYTITFVSRGETISTQTVTAGEMPAIPTVSGYEDDAKIYTFSGWSPAVGPAAGDTTYTAKFDETWKNYDITFNWAGGSEVVHAHWGDTPQAPTVSDYEDDIYTYTFTGWNPALAPCAGNATYDAVYSQEFKTYTVTFINENQVYDTRDYHYGDTLIQPDNPTKPADNTYTYTFTGWTPSVPATVTASATYTAQYRQDYINYTITFVGHDGVISTDTYHYGDNVSVPTVPGYEDDTYTYTFSNWDKEVTTVQGDTTYTAQYSNEYKNYTITFEWVGGSQDVSTHWGDMPDTSSITVPSYEEGGKTYSFIGWNPAVVPCAGNTTYTAQYSSEDIYYDITFIIEGVSQTQSVKANTMPDVPELVDHADPTDGDYQITFTGWDKAPAVATESTTYTALYTRDFVAADYSAVTIAQAAAAEINRDLYTDASLAVLDGALNAVVEGLGRTHQVEVDTMAADIEAAISALEYKPADYSAYNAAVEALQAELQKDDYTPDSIALVTQELADIDNALDKELKIIDQATVDNAKTAVEGLWDHLVVKADKTTLKQLIDEAQALDPDKYTDFSDVTAALATANTVYNDDNATNEEVASAITTLRSALNALVKKDADYTAWDALEAQFNNLPKQYYTSDSVAAVQAVLDMVQRGQDIDYQPTLDALTSDLQAAINALELTTSWAGETDWEGVDHEYFYSNLEYVQEVDEQDPTNIVVKVYLNHPVDTVDGIMLATLYDAQAMTFKSAEINNGTAIYTETMDAAFNPADYGLDAMGKAGILKIAADFDAALAPTEASRDLVATLTFTATGAASTSYIKNAPLAANTEAGHSVYSAIINDTTEAFMHSDPADLLLAEVQTGTVTGALTGDNMSADILLTLSDGTNEYTASAKGKACDYSFENVLPGTYTMTIASAGSLGYTVYNVVVEAGAVKEIPSINLLYGDCDNNGVISGQDIAALFTEYGQEVAPNNYCDVDGNGTVTGQDLGIILLSSHYGMDSSTQVMTLD
ncbi:MAG: hypothetical protein E7517_00370 [Ruminococcaceae bacterium]|nr:hypothetical protein [Oscillospiraceae bacterium]